jgi:hypothetical protein
MKKIEKYILPCEAVDKQWLPGAAKMYLLSRAKYT